MGKYLFFVFMIFSSVSVSQTAHYDLYSFEYPKGIDVPNPELVNSNIGLQLGLGFGVYFAGRQSAAYYNGKRNNNLARVLVSTHQNYQDLKEYFNHDFDVDTNLLPQNMSYDPAVSLLFGARYNFNENNGFVLEFAYSKLSAYDMFALVIDDPSNTTSEPRLELGNIWGKEERVNINLAYSKTFGKPKRIKPYWEAGFSITDTKVVENKAQMANFTYDLKDPYDSYYGVKEGGISLGFFAMQGVLINISESFSMQAGAQYSRRRIALQEEGAPLSNEWLFFFRLVYKNLFGSIA